MEYQDAIDSFNSGLNDQKAKAEVSSELFIRNASMLIVANTLIVGTLQGAMERNSGVSGTHDVEAKDRLLLGAAFYQGIFCAERLTRESYYTQAASVIRQQLECLAALIEAKNGKRVLGTTPNVSVIGKAFGPKYGDLSRLAHVSVPAKLEEIHKLHHSESDKPVVSIAPI